MPLSDNSPTLAESSARFVAVALEALCETEALDFDLFLPADPGSSPALFRERKAPLVCEDFEWLISEGIQNLYVSVADHIHVRRYMQQPVLDTAHTSPVHRYQALKQLNKAVFDSILGGKELHGVVQFATVHASHLANVVCDRDLVLADLFSLMDHDYYTYSHAANVSAYCLALAKGLGISDQSDLVAIGTGALLHDLGKRQIPADVLNKPGKLDDAERELIEQHPRTAFDELAVREDLNWDQLMIVYQHHERLDGSGYPIGLEGDEIHPWAKICAIADVFDALTSDRPYRTRDSVESALAYLDQMSESGFDRDMVLCFSEIARLQQPSAACQV